MNKEPPDILESIEDCYSIITSKSKSDTDKRIAVLNMARIEIRRLRKDINRLELAYFRLGLATFAITCLFIAVIVMFINYETLSK